MSQPNIRRRRFLAAFGAAGLASVAGCSDDADDSPPTAAPTDTGGRPIRPEWRTATEQGANSLHIYHLDDIYSIFRVNTLLDGAYSLDEDDEFYSKWIRDIENVDDVEYVYTLRENLEWGGDYGSMTADDWVFHYDAVVGRAVDGDNWTGHVNYEPWAEVASVEAEDDLTFSITLEEPNPFWIKQPAMWKELIYPADLVRPYYEAYLDGDGNAGEALAEDDDVRSFAYTGNLGPYELATHDRYYRWVATRNDDYYRRGTEPDAEDWAHAPYFRQITIRTTREQSERLAALENRDLSGLEAISSIPPSRIDDIRSRDHVTVKSIPTPTVYLTAYNQRANGWEPFRDPEVRRAFSMAVNKEFVTEQLYHGSAEPAHTFQPEWSEFYDGTVVEPFGVGDSYDPERARSMLESNLGPEYGYDGGELLGADGTEVQLTLVHRARTTAEEETGNYIGDQYEQELGVDVERKIVETQAMADEYVGQRTEDGELVSNAGDRDRFTSRRDWDVIWSLDLSTVPRSPTELTRIWGRNAPGNFMGWHPSEEVDIRGLVRAAGSDVEKLAENLAEIYGVLSREQPANFMFFQENVAAYDETIRFTEPLSRAFGYKSSTWYKETDPFG